jgi:hypothetical protein
MNDDDDDVAFAAEFEATAEAAANASSPPAVSSPS